MKSSTHVVPTKDTSKVEIVTALGGRNLGSMPAPARKKAKKAAAKKLATPLWAHAHKDPNEARHLAHVVANSRMRREPTRANAKKQAVMKSLQG